MIASFGKSPTTFQDLFILWDSDIWKSWKILFLSTFNQGPDRLFFCLLFFFYSSTIFQKMNNRQKIDSFLE